MGKISQSWSLVIMAYNEEHTIKEVCLQAVDFLSPLPDDKKEILIVDDGSTDGTFERTKALSEAFSFVRIYRHKGNLGIGAALTRGYLLSRMENVCVVPGDGQFNLNELRAFRNVPPNTVVSFYRTSYPGYSVFRRFLTWVNRWLNRILFGFFLKDVNYIKIYKRDSLKKFIGPFQVSSNKALKSDLGNIRFVSKSSYIESEIMYHLTNRKLKIIQTPAGYLPRKHGVSAAVRPKTLKMVFEDICKLLRVRFVSRF